MKTVSTTILTLILLGFAGSLKALPIFENDSPLEIEITGPLGSLVENKEDRREWPFRLKIDELELDMLLKARGNSRMRVCDFPPLRFNLEEQDTAGTILEGLKRPKLVSPCNRGSRSESDVLEEYAAYRIFGLLSDVSYRVRLMHITYTDTDGRLNDAYRSVYGFLIEPLSELTSRVNGQKAEVPAISLKQLDQKQAALMYVFQYLVANTDWSLVAAVGDDHCCHNVELVRIGADVFTIPYDFDLVGLVNARYARPDPSMRIRNVRIRKYRGFCTDQDVLRHAIRMVSARESEVMRIVAELPVLTDKQKSKHVDYLGTFFEKAKDEDKLVRSFEKTCQ